VADAEYYIESKYVNFNQPDLLFVGLIKYLIYMTLSRTKPFLLAILLLNSQFIRGQQSIADLSSMEKVSVFKESFDNNANSWITDNNYVAGSIKNGSYVIRCKNFQNSTGLSYRPVKLDYNRDFEIEASFRIIKGTGGLLFGMTDKYDHYRIELTDKKEVLVVKNTISKSKNEILFTSSDNQYVNQGTPNKISVIKANKTYYFYINENLIKELSNIKTEGNQVGFNVGLDSEVSVDYLNISYLQKQEAPVLTNRDLAKKDSGKTSPINNTISVTAAGTAIALANRGDPEIAWTSPTNVRTQYDLYSASVRATVKSEYELTSVVFYVNGSPKGEAERRLLPGEKNKYIIEKTVSLDPGENTVYFNVTNKTGSKRSDDRLFINPEATKPVITWNLPEVKNVIVNEERLNIEVCVKSPSGLKSIKVLVNGENMGGDNVFKLSNSDNCNIKWQYPVILKEGMDNSIVVIAENAAGSTPSDSRIIRYSKAIAEKRIALVIGNSNYGTKTPLKNPLQDANLMEATLEGLGFVVDKYQDLGLKEMNAAVRDFSQKMKDNNVALFYYAGHGVQVDGKNYLIPIDAKLASKDDCEWEAFAVEDLLKQFEKNPKNVNIAILDACRSNPFTGWVRGEEAGFMPINKTNGMFISFATAPGSTAADGSSGNGLFTEELVKQMNVPQPIGSVFLNTRINVWDRSKQTQRPQEWNDLNGEFYFKKK
jgi:hypothetical protein